MISWYQEAIVSILLILPIGIAVVWLIRKRLTPRFPVLAICAAIATVAATLLLIAEFVHLDTSRLFLALIIAATFAGSLGAEAIPWSPSSILRALAIAAAGIAGVAALTANPTAAALALLAVGMLVKLHSDASPMRSRVSEDLTSGAMSSVQEKWQSNPSDVGSS